MVAADIRFTSLKMAHMTFSAFFQPYSVIVILNNTLYGHLGDCQRKRILRLGNYDCQSKLGRPDLFESVQCPLSASACFCVDQYTGETVEGTHGPRSSISPCSKYFAELTLVLPAQLDSIPADHLTNRVRQNLISETASLGYANIRWNSVKRIDRQTTNAKYNYVTSLMQVTGSYDAFEQAVTSITSRLSHGTLGSLKLNGELSRIRRVQLESLPDGRANARGEEPAQSDVPSDLRSDGRSSDGTMPYSTVLRSEHDSASRSDSYFSTGYIVDLLKQPGVLAGVVGAAITVLLLLILLIVFCVYRLRKRDEGSYALEEPKKLPVSPAYVRAPTREFYA